VAQLFSLGILAILFMTAYFYHSAGRSVWFRDRDHIRGTVSDCGVSSSFVFSVAYYFRFVVLVCCKVFHRMPNKSPEPTGIAPCISMFDLVFMFFGFGCAGSRCPWLSFLR
jgi:hypothetical protein